MCFLFLFKQKTAYEMRISDWSSDVCSSDLSYLPVEVLPSFAGMGGGGTGEGDRETALISRTLIEDDLRAKPADLLLIDVRGDSMMPDFLHGGQILVDKRDRDPRQPGPFALWDRSEEHTSVLQSLMRPSYTGICFKRK